MDDASQIGKMAVSAPIIRTECLTMTLYNEEKDRLFLTELWDSYADFSPDAFVWTPELVDHLVRNTIFSLETCSRLEVPGPSVSATCYCKKPRSISNHLHLDLYRPSW
jgi:hypothetical protein